MDAHSYTSMKHPKYGVGTKILAMIWKSILIYCHLCLDLNINKYIPNVNPQISI